MSFAFQGFGLGEYFKAQQRLTDILAVYFWGTFDAPSTFLSLGHTLEDLSEGIQHLFDENSNPNSAILRSDNRLNVQQMLRVSSHGVLDVVEALETLLQITEVSRDRNKSWCQDFFAALRSSRLEQKVVLLDEKFAFQSWKLKLFFRILRKATIRQYSPILIRAQEALTDALELQSKSKVLVPLESGSFDIISQFKGACNLGGSDFAWNLKTESTLLLIMHWLYTTKLGLHESSNFKQITVRTYVNLMKTGWLLKISYSHLEADVFSEETRTLVAILSGQVITMFQKLREQQINCPDPISLASEGDYGIFIEDEVGNPYPKSVLATSDPRTVFEGSLSVCRKYTGINQENHGAPSPSDAQFQHRTPNPASPLPDSPSASTFNASEDSSSSRQDTEGRSVTYSQLSLETASGSSPLLVPGHRPGSSKDPRNPRTHEGILSDERLARVNTPQVLQATLNEGGTNIISPRSEYSWNQKIDKQELGVRPGEIEILPRELPLIKVLVSYTGDLYGRWDSCSIRLFKDTAGSAFRILALKDGLESFDEHILWSQDNDLVPEYGYHDHEPVIYIRRNKNIEQGSSIFYKFQNANDMFNFQLAFLDELVEADFHAVQTLRIKRNHVENYQKAGVQFWSEQNTSTISLRGAASVGATGAMRSNATVKVHSTRIVMYMYQEKTMIFLFVTDSVEIECRESSRTIRIRSSSHHLFKNSTTVKAQTLGTTDYVGGIPLDKARLSIENEDNFEDFKWFEIEFATLDELHSFQLEFRKALNLRRKARIYAEELMRLAAQGVRRN